MKKEDKEFLLQDLSMRLPYGVKVHTNIPEMDYSTEELIECESDKTLSIEDIDWLNNDCGEFKPYLRPMSSMTEEEEDEYEKVIRGLFEQQLEFYLRRHLNFRGLIPKGLAIEAPEGMYIL